MFARSNRNEIVPLEIEPDELRRIAGRRTKGIRRGTYVANCIFGDKTSSLICGAMRLRGNVLALGKLRCRERVGDGGQRSSQTAPQTGELCRETHFWRQKSQVMSASVRRMTTKRK